MQGALIILAVLVAVGIVLYIHDRLTRKKVPLTDAEGQEATVPEDNAQEEEAPSQCCGQHIICEKESLSPFTTEAEYFDDEELDRYRGLTPDDYSPEETEEFRRILMTMRPEEVPAWVRALAVREVEIPAGLRDEVLLIVSELRNK